MTSSMFEERLYKIFQNVNEWLKFAEAKNFGLLTLNAAIVFGFTQTNFELGSSIRSAGFYVFAPFALLSFFFALISLFPIVSKIEKGAYSRSLINRFSNMIDEEKGFENIHFYGYLKSIDENEFEEKFKKKLDLSGSFNQFEKEIASQILYNARITWLKYQLFKIGAFIFLVGSFLFAIAVPIFNFCS
jgi:hypothetical protein